MLVLTGTDLYRDIHRSANARRAMEAADVLVTLQPAGLAEIPKRLRSKAVAIVQSAAPVTRVRRAPGTPFTICVLGHLRYEKDPMRAAYALRSLKDVRVRLVQAGRILDARFERALARESLQDPRFIYRGSLSQAGARRLLAHSDLLVQSSRIEGGANAVCEAIAAGVPIVASHISGNVGILGPTYCGYYPVGDAQALAARLRRAVSSPTYYARLAAACEALKPLVSPARERASWERCLRAQPPSQASR